MRRPDPRRRPEESPLRRTWHITRSGRRPLVSQNLSQPKGRYVTEPCGPGEIACRPDGLETTVQHEGMNVQAVAGKTFGQGNLAECLTRA